MQCPFITPVEKEISTQDALGKTYYRIIEANKHSIAAGLTEKNADYIVQAINSHEKLVERYKDNERLWKLADQDNCDGDCDLETPHKRCVECLARSALNDLGEMRGQLIDEIEQALETEKK